MKKIILENKRGFTIVELLIVIVVIAILATITIVAYNGIQARANDSAVQNDVSNLVKQIQLFYIDNGRYPTSEADLDTLNNKLATGSYANHTNAVMYCISPSAGAWSIAGDSKSGIHGYYYNSTQGGVKERAYWNAGNPCSDFGIQHTASGDWAAYKFATQTWLAGGNHIIP